MYDFAYERPTSVADAVKALTADPDAKALAGGQTFIPVLKQRLAKPTKIVDLAKIGGLSSIKVSGQGVTIGAMTTHATVANATDVQKAIPGLAELVSWIGDDAVRHRGTIGGSLANNDPTACYPCAVLALGATIKTDRRSIEADDYFQGMFTTALEPGELITEVTFPIPSKARYEKFRNPASRYAMVGVFVANGPKGVRVAVTGAGQNGVFRHTAMEQALAKSWSPDAVASISTPTDGLNGDIHGSAEYRAHLITVMAKRAVAATM
ncbi:MAG TPA: xanthine dehydrogenase family protein subunit M [Acetobacteraceae bacterium]|jgi:carbon-monoxide dehydrogenase medium subunit|nr:xanthine dehydrogenase family protein subunit M [Acetobacteraceae bacterium]